MSDKKRYVCVTGEGTVNGIVKSIHEARDFLDRYPSIAWRIHELSPEVKEPDYGPLIEWARTQGHQGDCRHLCHDRYCCNCGFADALKAAQIE